MMTSGDSRLSLLLLAPLVGSVLCLVSARVSSKLPGLFASLAVFLSFALSASLAVEITPGRVFAVSLGDWIAFGDVSFPFYFVFDQLAAVMCLVITGIGTLIHIYSTGYMAEDPGQGRFFAYLNLFVAAMLTLVLGGSLPVLFIGWEGVGLCSYLLIGFWFSNPDYARAGRKAFVMNRIGDLGLMIAMFALFAATGTLDIFSLNTPEKLGQIGPVVGLVAGLGLFLAATGKSAQIPLFTWLPDAMAGPTPVSALIHAATMVTAGVYLMARMHGVVELDPFVPALVCWIALATAVVAATTALAQNDIKKVLAYSTVSQLGFMFLAVGVGQYSIALFHVVTHAFFKACLFLSAGSVIHGCHHEQDMQKMGGLAKYMPLTCACYGIATLAIAGVWPFAGFFSKHGILDGIAVTNNPFLAPYASCIGLVAKGVALLTALYMARSFVLTFLGSYRGGAGHEGHAHGVPHEVPLVMGLPVALLAGLSFVGGYFLDGCFLSFLSGVLPHAHHGHLEIGGVLLGSLPGVVGIALGVLLFQFAPILKDSLRRIVQPLEWLFRNKFFVDELYECFIVAPIRAVSAVCARAIDAGIIDGGVSAVGKISEASGELVRRVTTGQVATYVLLMFMATSALIGLFIQR